MFAHNHGKYRVKNSRLRMRHATFDVALNAGIAYLGFVSWCDAIGVDLEFVHHDVETQYGASILIVDNALALGQRVFRYVATRLPVR